MSDPKHSTEAHSAPAMGALDKGSPGSADGFAAGPSSANVKQEPEADAMPVSKRQKIFSAEAQAASAVIAATATLPTQVMHSIVMS